MSANDRPIVVQDRVSAHYVLNPNPQETYTASEAAVAVGIVLLANTERLMGHPMLSWRDLEDSTKASQSECIYASKEDTAKTILSFKDMREVFGSDEVAPSPDGVVWLANSFREHYVLGSLLPAVFPTSWGGIRMEWSVGGQAVVVDIDLERKIAKWLSFYLEDDTDERDVEKAIDLAGDEGWDYFNRMVQALAYTE